MKIETMQDLFICELEDIYYAEKQIVKALPKMAEKATHPRLKNAFESHLRETEHQIKRAEQVFAQLALKPKTEKCEALLGLLKEADELMKDVKDPDVMDAALIVSAQKVEHYEIAAYGTLAAIADLLGYTEAAIILRETLDEEQATDTKLNDLALEKVNQQALMASSRHAAE